MITVAILKTGTALLIIVLIYYLIKQSINWFFTYPLSRTIVFRNEQNKIEIYKFKGMGEAKNSGYIPLYKKEAKRGKVYDN